MAKQSATTEHELAESSDEVGPSWSKASGMNIAAATAAAMLADVARLREQLQHLWDVPHTREMLVE